MERTKPRTTNPAGNASIKLAPPGGAGASRDAPHGSEFKRFEGLAQKVVRVPKAEVDDKRRKA